MTEQGGMWDLIKPYDEFTGRISSLKKHHPDLRYEANPPDLLDEPQYPQARDVNPAKTRFGMLTKGEKEDF
jgi:hypothetical protein